MPTATTLVRGLPVAPSHSPLRTFSLKSFTLSSTSQTSLTTFLPSTLMTLLRGARVATCSTARSSVLLMVSPANMAPIFAFSPAASASWYSLAMVSLVTRWRAKSQYTPLYSTVRPSQRSLSMMRSRRCVFSMSFFTCSSSASHSGVVLMSAEPSLTAGTPRARTAAPRWVLPAESRLDILYVKLLTGVIEHSAAMQVSVRAGVVVNTRSNRRATHLPRA
mmetsp:Transcript_8143/g.20572  ORF Transcript_8143/g.20572 Transcript_8143/m.20572 type:complete len:220 (-) Transcript_8143:15-674(-)